VTSVRAELDGAVLRVTLCRPERANALDMEVGADLRKALEAIGPGVRAVLLLAEGPNFCVGGDVTGFAGAADPEAHVLELATEMHAILRDLTASGVPVVVGVQGWAAGAGLSLLLHGDVVVLGASARVRAGYPAIGLTPDCGMSWLLPRAVGPARARDMLLTNRVVGAQEALAIGLVSRVVPDDEVAEVAAKVARELAAAATGALRATRRLLEASATSTYTEQLDAEAASISARAATPEGREGVAAFVGKRPARFSESPGSPE
jgi:2-(1,2-epoxy-1,2-dihydrophenyl)acetyl-CoA isomerase